MPADRSLVTSPESASGRDSDRSEHGKVVTLPVRVKRGIL